MIPLLTDALACYRLTRLLTTDRVAEPLRARVDSSSTAGYLIRCDWCMSVWCGGAVVAARHLAPRVWAPVATALAFSAVTGLIAENA
jgi:hypothetical protein